MYTYAIKYIYKIKNNKRTFQFIFLKSLILNSTYLKKQD